MGIALRRYPEYKDSGVPWLGKIPAHWQSRRQRNLVSLLVSNVDKHMHEDEYPVRLCNYVDVYKNDYITDGIPFMRATASLGEINRFRLRKGDVVITKDSETWDDIGVPALVHYEAPDLVCGYHLAILRPRQSIICGDFLLRALQSQGVAAQHYVSANGITRFGLSHDAIKSVWIALPPLEEQAAIARFLDHFDRLTRRYIRAQRRLIELLTEQKQALIQQAVTRGLDPHVKLKPSGVEWLGEIPAHWEVRQIGHLAKLGNGSTPSRSNAAYWANGDYPWLNSSSVNQGTIAQADQFVTPLALRECHLPIVRPNSVLVAITGQGKTRGTAALLTVEATINQHIAFIAPQEEILSPEYLRLFLTGAYGQLRAISDGSGSTKGALTCADLKHFKAAIPPRSEQDMLVGAVGESVGRIDAGIGGTERQIDLIREYRTRLIADVVTGKLDVRQTAANLPEPEEEGSDYEDETPDDDDLDEQEVDDAE